MWLVILHLMSSGFAEAPVVIQVEDPAVTHVEIKCKDQTRRAPVVNGAAEFPNEPEQCTVYFRRKSGTINSAGKWNCNLNDCALSDVHHAPISNRDGRINVVLTHPVDAQILEVHCPGDFRARQSIVENTAVFDNIPDNECTLLLKGGAPARFAPLRWGTYYCSVAGPLLTCIRH